MDRMDGRWTVGEVAALTHVSVRTLHHYDELGLLPPSSRSASGYRFYDEADLARLRQILFYRELEFGLDDIAAMLADPGRTAEDHLREQHRLLRDQISHRQDLLRALEKEMEAREMGIALTPEEQFEIFGTDAYGAEYADEAEQRWGGTEAWRQSQARTAAFNKEDWIAIKADTDELEADLASALRRGVPVDSAEAAALAERHRAQISRFWDCDHGAHRCLGEMYVADERFRAHYDAVTPGLAQYLRDVIDANATRAARD